MTKIIKEVWFKTWPFVLFFVLGLPILVRPISNCDELWNYNFAINVLNGHIPYKDFSIVQTPLSVYISAFILWVFGNELIVFRLAGIFLIAVSFGLLYKIIYRLSNSKMLGFIASSYAYILIYYTWIYSYNNINLFLVLLIAYLELKITDNESNDSKTRLLISFIYGLILLIKQSTGVVLLISYVIALIIGRKKSKALYLMRNISIAAIPGILYLICLVTTGSFNEFIEYAVLGIGEFTHRIYIWESFVSAPISFLMSLFVLYVIVCSIIKIGRKQSCVSSITHLRLLILSFAAGFVAYPLTDYYHMMVAVIPYIICLFCCVRPRTYSKNQKLVCILITVSILFFSSIDALWELKSYKISNLNHYKGIPMKTLLEDNINDVNKYICLNEETKSVKVIVADESAVAYMIPLDKYTKNFDMLLIGNLGVKTVEELLSENKGAIYLVLRDQSALGYQSHFELIQYIKDNYIKIGEVRNFDAYKEKN